MQHPMPCDRFTRAQPHALVPLYVVEQPGECANSSRTPDDSRMQADGQHARPALVAQAVQPVESIAAISEELLAGPEISAALQAAVIDIEAIRQDQVRAALHAGPVG